MVLKDKLSQLNVLLIVLTLGIIVLTTWNFLSLRQKLDLEHLHMDDNYNEGLALGSSADTPLESLDHYQGLFATKRLFRPLIKKGKKTVKVITIEEIARDFLLIGVVKENRPEAIVKNRRTRQTFFVKKGANLGQLKVEEVGDDQITVSYEGKQKTLFIQ